MRVGVADVCGVKVGRVSIYPLRKGWGCVPLSSDNRERRYHDQFLPVEPTFVDNVVARKQHRETLHGNVVRQLDCRIGTDGSLAARWPNTFLRLMLQFCTVVRKARRRLLSWIPRQLVNDCLTDNMYNGDVSKVDVAPTLG